MFVLEPHMRLPAGGIAAVLGALALTFAGPQPAEAGFSFTKPRQLTADLFPAVERPVFAPGSRAGGVAAWESGYGADARIIAARVDDRGRVGARVEITRSRNGEELREPVAAITADGTAAIAWTALRRSPAPVASVRAAALKADGTLGRVRELDAPPAASEPQILADSSGAPIVVWASYDYRGTEIGRTQLRWIRLTSSGAPDGPVNEVPLGVSHRLSQLQLGIDASDRVTAAWAAPGRRLATIRFGLEGGRGPLHRLGGGNRRLLDLAIAVAPKGRATIVSRETRRRAGRRSERLRAVQVSPSGEPQRPLDISSDSPEILFPAAVADARGRVTIVWQRRAFPKRGPARSRIMGRKLEPAGEPGERLKLSAGSNLAIQPDLAIDRRGRVYAAWRRSGRGRPARIQVSRLSRQGSVSRTAVAGRGQLPELGVTGNGRPVVLWFAEREDGRPTMIAARR